jgi:hypothetical protein
VQLANIREGGSFAAVPLTISNNAVNVAGFTETLAGAFSNPSATVATTGTINNLAPGSTDSSSLTVRLTDSTAGARTGSVTFTPTSQALSGSGLNNTTLTAQTVTVQGSVFRLAVASAPASVDFGIRHVGDAAPSQSLTLSNTAVDDGFSERLNATIGNATGGITTNAGSISQLAPGVSDTSSLSVGMNTATVGDKSGTATISLASDGTGTSGLSPLALTAKTVNVTGQVNHFAQPELFYKSGDATLTQISATEYLLDFGKLVVDSGSFTVAFGIENFLLHSTFQDALGGSFLTSTVQNFALAGFAPFDGIAPGAVLDPDVTFETAGKALGLCTDSFSFTPTSRNASSVTGLAPIQVEMRAQVVPEPSSIALLALSASLLGLRRRRH